MLSLYRTLSLRYLSRRWLRACLIVASIALGVAALVATRALNATMTRAALTAANPMAGIADLVVSNGELPIAHAMAKEISQVYGVVHVRARLFENARLPEFDNRAILVMGIDVVEEFKDQSDEKAEITLSPGAALTFALLLPTQQIPVIVGKELDNDLPKDQKQIKVKKNQLSKEHVVTRAGALEARGNAAALGGYVLILDLASAAHVLDIPPGMVNRLDIVLGTEVDRRSVRKEIEKVLGGRADVRTPEEQNQSLQSVMAGMQTGFSLCGVAALVVGLFLVYNSLAVSVAERRHEIGILLSLGATRRQIHALFAGEAACMGLVGSLLGIPLGVALAQFGLGPLQDVLRDVFFTVEARTVDVSMELIVTALLVGVVTAVAAALVPALQASQENPAEAVRRVDKPATMRRLLMQISISVAMMLVGGVMILFRQHIPLRLGTYGGLFTLLVGALVASPIFATLAARAMQPVIRRFLGIEWRLAADNLVRSPKRTGLVIGALAAGVSLVVQTAGTIRSNRIALADWVEDAIVADLIVTSGSPVGAGGQSLPMDTRLGDDFHNVHGVDNVLPLRFRKVLFRDTQVFIMALDPRHASVLERVRAEKKEEIGLYQRLRDEPNTVIVSENFAALHGVRPGDTLSLPSPAGELRLRIVGSLVDYSWNHGTIFMNRSYYMEHFRDDKVDVFDVYLGSRTDAAAAKQALLSKFGAQYGLHVLTRGELQTRIDEMIERLYGIAYGQQVVVMLVAALGVVTALLISVLQRRREIGLLRAIGATPVQVIRSVLAEACLMGVLGTVIGFVVGIPLQWYILEVVILEESGYLFPMHIPWLGGLVIAAVAMTAATLAGLGPALYAVRQRIPDAIAYE
ncbi:MAG: FtsX-like permease family protein [Gemmataceae bacterium]|nr:FtsX-like permease family protein [Gemmataceae bacterium]MCI0743080.1 FtsX-like permease family protein [Gemmataceae bacterium]